jgi:uncharacterized protein (TIGR03083 family)
MAATGDEPPVMNDPSVTDAFAAAAEWFVATVASVGPDQWEEPGLGEWTVRQLVGHAGRALLTVEEYFRSSCPADHAPPSPGADADPVGAAGAYFLGTHGAAQLHSDVAERGRQAGRDLGPDPGETVRDLGVRVVTLVRSAPDGALFVSRFGVQPFATYLCTRTVELVVHTVDICSACGLEAHIPEPAARTTLAVMVETARRRGEAVDVLRALAGRAGLASGFNVFG